MTVVHWRDRTLIHASSCILPNAVVWRHAIAPAGSEIELGPYLQVIQNELLSGGPYSLQMLVGVSPLTLKGEDVDVAIAPYRHRLRDFNSIHFTVARLNFYLKTDRRQFPAAWADFLADKDPIVLTQLDRLDLLSLPKFRPIFAQMARRS